MQRVSLELVTATNRRKPATTGAEGERSPETSFLEELNSVSDSLAQGLYGLCE